MPAIHSRSVAPLLVAITVLLSALPNAVADSLRFEPITISPLTVETLSVNNVLSTKLSVSPSLSLAPIRVLDTLETLNLAPKLKLAEPTAHRIYLTSIPVRSMLPQTSPPMLLPRLEKPPVEKEIHYYRGKPPTVPEGNFYGSIGVGSDGRHGMVQITISNGLNDYSHGATIDSSGGGSLVFSSSSVPASNSTVPEPSSLTSALLALLGGIGLRRNRPHRLTRP